MSALPALPASRRSRARRTAVASALVLASLICGELAARALLWALGRPYHAEHARAVLTTWENQLGPVMPLPGEEGRGTDEDHISPTLHPYVGWAFDTDQAAAAEADYYRSQEAIATYDVCVLGGSVAHGFALFGRDRFFEKLRGDPRFAERPLAMHAYALPGYKEPQQVMLLAFLLNLGHAPDAVIEIDGFNEVALGNQNSRKGTSPLYPSLAHWAALVRNNRVDAQRIELLHEVHVRHEQARASCRRALDSGCERSAVIAHAALWRVGALRKRYYAAYQALIDALADADAPELRGPPASAEGWRGLALIVRTWEESSRLLRAMCAEHGIDYLHVLQPTLHDVGSKPLTPEEIASGGTPEEWVEGVHLGYPLLRTAGERLRANGVPFLDASFVFRDVTETLYYDGCHFGRRGYELFADAVAEALLATMGAQR